MNKNNQLPQQFDIQKMLQHKKQDQISSFTKRDAIIYALSIGYSRDPMDINELKFTYEKDKNFTIFPTFSCVHNQIDFLQDFLQIPGPKFDPYMLVHGEHNLEIFKPLKPDTQYKTQAKVIDIQDKGKGTIYSIQYSTYEILENDKSELTYQYVMTTFIRGLTGLNYKGTGYKNDIPKQPQTEPDNIYREKILENQAIMYRLTGDINPLHVDPQVAKKVGFKQPILHGLCFYALAAKAVTKTYCNDNVNMIKKVNCRFTASVYPGEEIQYNMWKQNNNQIIISGIVKERQKQVIFGYVSIKDQPKL